MMGETSDRRPEPQDGGWSASAKSWIELIDRGEPNRERLLDPVVLDQCGDVTAYLESGLILQSFLEPVPTDDSLKFDPRFEDWYRVPLFNVMRWLKPA